MYASHLPSEPVHCRTVSLFTLTKGELWISVEKLAELVLAR
jgi:hypothetical protein